MENECRLAGPTSIFCFPLGEWLCQLSEMNIISLYFQLLLFPRVLESSVHAKAEPLTRVVMAFISRLELNPSTVSCLSGFPPQGFPLPELCPLTPQVSETVPCLVLDLRLPSGKKLQMYKSHPLQFFCFSRLNLGAVSSA